MKKKFVIDYAFTSVNAYLATIDILAVHTQILKIPSHVPLIELTKWTSILTQENLNLDEKEIELMEEVNYNLVEKEKGSENECDEDDDSRVFVLDEISSGDCKNYIWFTESSRYTRW
ncbi:1850_t:CDS:2 [Entrophospora sp. SA101]|nr:1850_t:CDS:2 [Entrophospora sp. SA101]